LWVVTSVYQYAHLYREVTASDVVQTVCEAAAASEERTGMVVRIILGTIVRHPGLKSSF